MDWNARMAILGGVLCGLCFMVGWDVLAWNLGFVALYVTIAMLT